MSEPARSLQLRRVMDLRIGPDMDEETLAALASGRADPGVALFIDTMLAMRGAAFCFGEAASGALFEAEAPAAVADDALANVFAAIDAAPTSIATPEPSTSYPEVIRLPARLQALVRDAEAKQGWTFAGRGIRSLQIDLGGGAQTQLLRISPGARTPRHTHYGREASLCLIGGFSDNRGAYGPGDVSLTDPSVTHQPIGDKDGVCYVLALTDAGLRFTGVFGVIQKLLGQ